MKTMNLVFETMKFVLETMDFVLKTMDFAPTDREQHLARRDQPGAPGLHLLREVHGAELVHRLRTRATGQNMSCAIQLWWG